MKLKYTGKLKILRRKLKVIDGVSVVGKSVLMRYLTTKELAIFIQRFKWRKLYSDCVCSTCGNRHHNKKLFKRYAIWWDVVKLLHGD